MNILDIRNVINSTKFNNSNVDIIKFNGQEAWTAGYWLTKTGYPLMLTNSLGKKLKDYKIYGNSVDAQDVGEKTDNIFNGNMQQGMYLYTNGTYLFVQNYICSTNRIAVEQNAKYYIDVMYSGSDTLSGKIIYYDESGSYVSYAVIDNLSTNSFTTLSNASYMALDICKTSGANITVDEIENITISKKSGTTEPYGYKVPIVVSGKNLFDKSDLISIYINATTGAITSIDNSSGNANFIPVIPSDTYVWSGFTGNTRTHYYDKNYTWLSSNVQASGGTFTVPENAYYIKFCKGTPVSELQNYDIQLERGTTATTYEQYKTPITTNIYLDEPLRKFEDNEDYIDFTNQKIIRNVKVENGTYSQLVPPLEQTVSLPEIMTIKGTCILSCNTTLVPSNMSATYKSSKNI